MPTGTIRANAKGPTILVIIDLICTITASCLLVIVGTTLCNFGKLILDLDLGAHLHCLEFFGTGSYMPSSLQGL
jgi:hypothetical protein